MAMDESSMNPEKEAWLRGEILELCNKSGLTPSQFANFAQDISSSVAPVSPPVETKTDENLLAANNLAELWALAENDSIGQARNEISGTKHVYDWALALDATLADADPEKRLEFFKDKKGLYRHMLSFRRPEDLGEWLGKYFTPATIRMVYDQVIVPIQEKLSQYGVRNYFPDDKKINLAHDHLMYQTVESRPTSNSADDLRVYKVVEPAITYDYEGGQLVLYPAKVGVYSVSAASEG